MFAASLARTRIHTSAARDRASGEPTRHEWIRELALVLAGLLVYFGVRAATTDEAGPARPTRAPSSISSRRSGSRARATCSA